MGVCQFALDHRTTGDLFLGPGLGARRAAAGLVVYDTAGLEESVNASPFVIALLRPWGTTAVERFLPAWLLASAAALAGFIAYAWSWLRLIFDGGPGQPRRPGVAELGLVVAATCSFTSLQRSLRLGQLDAFVLVLLTAGAYHAARCLRQPGRSAWHGWLGGFLLALAAGVKILPGVVVLALALAGWGLARRHPETGKRALFPLAAGVGRGAAAVATVAWLGGGTAELGRFFTNLPLMLRGSAAGANYALVARFAKYADPSLRLAHAPLSASALFWLWPLRALALLALAVAARRLVVARLPLLFGLSLALLPLVSSLVWDVYFVWCALLPWILLAAWELAHGHRRPPLVRVLRGMLLAASYFLLGVAGTGLVRNPVTNHVAEMGVPLWFDEARLVGLGLLIATLLWELERPVSSADSPASDGAWSACDRS